MSARKIVRAPARSKAGWPRVASQIPPELEAKLVAYEDREHVLRTDAILRAIEHFLSHAGVPDEAARCPLLTA